MPLPLPPDPLPLPPDLSPVRRRKIIEGTYGELAASVGAAFLENNGLVLVLFETPSGFAIFGFCGLHLYRPDALESVWLNFTSNRVARNAVWLNEFQTFDDKSSAINDNTGVNEQLAEMITKWRCPGQELVVGKPEYKSIIETSLGIPCLHNEIVMELMWGMKRFMHALVPSEKLELPKEDNLLMSRGLQILLSRHGFDDVKPEMVNEQILRAASALFICDAVEQKQYKIFFSIGQYLKDVSGINYENWNLLELGGSF